MNYAKIAVLLLVIGQVSHSACAQTWMPTSAPVTNWFSIACSADGAKLAAVNSIAPEPNLGSASPIYLSTNSGISFAPSGPFNVYSGNANWGHLAASADGSKLIVGSLFGPLYISGDSGITWTAAGPPGGDAWNDPENFAWDAVASSTDGHILAAVAQFSPLISTDSGTTWSPGAGGPSAGVAIAISADGTKLITGGLAVPSTRPPTPA